MELEPIHVAITPLKRLALRRLVAPGHRNKIGAEMLHTATTTVLVFHSQTRTDSPSETTGLTTCLPRVFTCRAPITPLLSTIIFIATPGGPHRLLRLLRSQSPSAVVLKELLAMQFMPTVTLFHFTWLRLS